ncbi:MAG: sugar transferase [Verrucomicrobia bacterium]|nr:sugar transferase [Verrucomicrobiota bacterium]
MTGKTEFGQVRQLVSNPKSATRRGLPLWKRLLDLILVLATAPFWLVFVVAIAIWIKVVSPGSIFFFQERLGYRGRRFMIFKFRTMEVNAETRSHEEHLQHLINSDCPMTKLDASGDRRIIFGGRLLRATGLDELPQLFNVLRGEMSLIGPRPCTPQEYLHYKPWQAERLNAFPGLTGYWQVNGKNKTTFSEMIEMDIHYARNLSPSLDLLIIFKTFPAILQQLTESKLPVPDQKISVQPITRKAA